MKAQDFTHNPLVKNILFELKNDQAVTEKRFSDVEDAEGFQYVDLVMEGGGVWGIALAGYVYVLEEMGIRFLQLGGASAGAINTLLMASSGPINEKKTDWILDKLAQKDLSEFIDGDDDAVDFINTVLGKAKLFKLIRKGAQIVDNIRDDQGLNPGDDFLNWLKACIAEHGIHTTNDLEDMRKVTPKGLVRKTADGDVPYSPEDFSRIGLISSEVTTETKVEFPRMADLYFADKGNVNPAEYARASMSIPVFFHPYKVKNIPQGEGTWEKWKKETGYLGGAPSEVKFIDGGMVSNFPIDIFHDFRTPTPAAPTFGVKLEVDRNKPNDTDNILKLIGAIFNTSRHIHDYQFILKHPDFEQLVTYIDTGDHNWLNFNLTDEDQMDLFVRGAKAAALFLRKFNWEHYKKTRETIYQYKKTEKVVS